jgi:tetratricopeptide (TPR) repeat protein
MVEPSKITRRLNNPSQLSSLDRKDVDALLQSYPYLVPLRYLEASSDHQQAPFARTIMNRMQLYRGNWILFHEFLESSLSSSPLKETPAAQQADAGLEESNPRLDIETELEDFDFADFNTRAEIPSFREFTERSMKEEEAVFELEEEESEALEIPPAKFDLNEPEVKAPRSIQDYLQYESAAGSSKPEPQNQGKQEPLIQPIYTEDYFLHQGIPVSDNLPKELEQHQPEVDKSLMVVMSFSEWLTHFKTRGERQKEEREDQRALKTMWQKEKLAAALEEENEEIPENVFEMAVNSITKEEDLVSESLAEILVKQGKLDKAIDMFRKLSLRNPQKSAYFARKIDEIQKEK